MKPFGTTRVAVLCAIASTAAEPQAAPNPPPAPKIIDSAGVRIAEHRSIWESYSAGRLIPSQRRIVGGIRGGTPEELDPGHPFIASIRLSNGHIVVSDWASLKFYDRSGAFLKSSGRRGSGPGEFVQLRRVCRLPGDTVLAMSYSDRRMSLWTSDGEFIRELPRVGVGPAEPCFPDGTLLVIQPPKSRRSGFSTPGLAPHVRIRLDGGTVSEFGELPIEEYTAPVRPVVSVVVQGDRVYAATGKTFEVRTYSGLGRLLGILRVLAVPKRGTPARARDASEQANVPRPERGDARDPPLLLPFAEVRADPRGRIWIQDYVDRLRWFLFTGDGTFLGAIRIPESADSRPKLVGFDQDELVIRDADSSGSPVIRWYRLELRTR